LVHIIGPGRHAILSAERGVPVDGRHLMETTDVYTTGAWNTAGTFYLTCSVHPEMTRQSRRHGCCCEGGA